MSLRARDHGIGESETCPTRSSFAAVKQNFVIIVEDHVASHKCFEENLRLLILAGDEWINNEEEIIRLEGELENTGETEVECQWMDLFVCSTGGFTQPQTMKLEGLIQGKRVLILIDSGACHNFISQELVQQLGLKVTPTQTDGVRLGDGNRKNAQGCCEQMEVQPGQMTITKKFFLFDLCGVDVILG